MPACCRIVPGSVVRGIQLAVGLSLAQKGITLVAYPDNSHTHFRGAVGLQSMWPGLVAAAAILVTTYLPVRGVVLGCMSNFHSAEGSVAVSIFDNTHLWQAALGLERT